MNTIPLQDHWPLITIFYAVIAIFWGVLTFLMPFVIWSMRKELKRHSLLMRGIIDELRLNRTAASRSPQIHPPR